MMSLKDERYYIPETINTAFLITGAEVRIRWEEQDGRRVVTWLQVTEFPFFGRR